MKHILKVLLMISVVLCCFNSSEAATVKSDFMYLYQFEWTRANLKYKLYEVTEKIFKENSSSSRFHTFAFQLGINKNNIIERMQKDIFKSFDVHYEGLLDNLNKRLPKNYEKIKETSEQNFIAKLWPELDAKLAHPLQPLNWFIAGLIFFIMRIISGRFVEQNLYNRKFKMFRLAIMLTGIILCVIGVYKSSENATIMRIETRKFLSEKTQEFYIIDLPEKFIEALG